MLNSEALEVGIGMAFLFLLVSLICTGIKEWIEGIFKWRAMDLERALRTLLDDEKGELAAHLFAHPVVSALYQGIYDPSRLTRGPVARWVAGMPWISWISGGANALQMPLSARRNLPSYIPAGHFAKALIDLVARGPTGSTEEAAYAPLTVGQIRERAAMLDSPFLRRVILTAVDHAGGDLERVTLNVQRWFDGSMDRASGWYKRRAQAVLFILGIGAAGVLNIDALHVMGRLTADKTFRDVVVSAAEKAQLPASAPAAGSLAYVKEARNTMEQVGMPVGWVDRTIDTKQGTWPVQMCKLPDLKTPEQWTCKAGAPAVLQMVFGWLVTAFAVMLGAPFWFDVLNKFMVIRSTVKPHEKSREEGSEDRTDRATEEAADTPGTTPNPGNDLPNAPPPAVLAPALPAFEPHRWRDGFVNPSEISL